MTSRMWSPMLTPGVFLEGGLRNKSSQTGPAYEARAAYFERITRCFGLSSRLAERGRHPYDAVNCRCRAITRSEQAVEPCKRTGAPPPANALIPGPTHDDLSDPGKEENHDEPDPHVRGRQVTRTVHLAGTSLELVECGQGRPLLFLHAGEGLAPERPWLDLLSRHYWAIAPWH